MNIIIAIICICVLLSIILFIYCCYEYDTYIKRLSDKYTSNDTIEIINHYKKLLEQDEGNTDILDTIELFEQAHNYKESQGEHK